MQLRTIFHPLIIFLFLCCFAVFHSGYVVQAADNPLLQYQVKEKVSSFRANDIVRDILVQLNKKEYSSVNDLISFLVIGKPMSDEGMRLLEEVYSILLKRGDEKLFDVWCKSAAPSHAAYMLRGRVYLGKAMDIRGDDWGYTISAEQRRLMRENYDKAHKDLVKAYEMNPADPVSPAKMITVCIGKGLPEQVMESWFAKSIAADPIALSAYEGKFAYLKPIWHGSQEKLKAYAEDCFQNAPPGSSVYSIMLRYIYYTVRYEIRGNGSIRQYLERPDVKRNINTGLERLLADFPKSTKFKMLRAKFLAYKGATGQMLDIYNAAIKKYPEHTEAYSERAFFYLRSEMYDKAEADYFKLITLDPKDAQPYTQLATIYLRRDNDFEKALIYLDKALAIQPNDKRIMTTRGELYIKRGKNEKAIEDFTSVLAIDPFDSYALFKRSAVYERLGQIDKAIGDVLKMKELARGSGQSLEYQLNRLLEKSEKKENVDSAVAQSKAAPGTPAVTDSNSAAALQPAQPDAPMTRLNGPEIDALFQQGEAFFYRKKAAAAKKIFQRILEEQPENSRANFMMGRIVETLDHNPEQAVTYYSRAIALENKNEKFLARRGIALYMARRYEQAIVDFTTVLDIMPQHGAAVYYRGLCFDALGDREAAIKDMKLTLVYDLEHYNEARRYLSKYAQKSPSAVSVDPVQEMLMSAEEDMRLNRYDEAEKTWQEIIKKDPQNHYAFFRQGIIAIYRDRDHKKAISFFDQAIKLEKTRTDYYYNRGRSQMLIKDYQVAITNYDELLTNEPNYGPGYYYRAECFEKTGEFVKAEQDLLKAKKYAPDLTKKIEKRLARLSLKTGTKPEGELNNVNFLINRSDSYVKEREFEAAINDLKAALELKPDSDKALYKMGRIYEEKFNDREKALPLYSKAIELRPETKDYLFKRGMIYYRSNKYAKAIDDFTACLNINVDDQYLYYRGMANKKLNNKDQAIDDLLKAKEMDSSWGESVDYTLSTMMN